MKENTDSPKKGNKKLVILICILIAIIAGLIVAVVILFNSSKQEEHKKAEVRSILVNEDNKDTFMQEFEDNSEDTKYHCRMSTNWTFQSGGIKSEDAYVANIEPNHYPIYFEVKVNGEEEPYYTSPTIPVGSEIKGLELDRKLEPGDYDGTVDYHLINDDGDEVSSMAFTIVIHVLK